MDAASISTASSASSMEQGQTAIAGKMLKMNADAAQSVAQMLESARQSVARVSNLPAGVGGILDVHV